MADPSLNQPVILRAININAASIPIGWSPAYTQYILSQAADFTSVADKANEAGKGAYDAQVKNDEQDLTLADHEGRITANTQAIQLLDVRLTTAEGKIDVLRNDVDYLLDKVTEHTSQHRESQHKDLRRILACNKVRLPPRRQKVKSSLKLCHI